MLVKFNQSLNSVKPSEFNFAQVTVGSGYADAIQCKDTLPPSMSTSLPIAKTDT